MRARRGAVWAMAAGALVAAAGCMKIKGQGELMSSYAPVTGDAVPDYVVETPDSISIEVLGEPGLSRGAQLRPDGKITMPYLGDVSVTGLTPLEIDEKLTKLYTKYVKEPEITVTVSSFASKVVYLFRDPGSATALPYTGNQDFLKTISRAGGVGSTGWETRVLLVRATPEKAEIKRVNLARIVTQGRVDEAHNPTILPGDIIYVRMDPFSWVGYHINKLLIPVTSLFQPVRAVDTWRDVFSAE